MSETMRRVNELADLLARECPLRELFAAVRETEGNTQMKEPTQALTYAQAKLAAIDLTIVDPDRLRAAAAALLGRFYPTDEDRFDAQNLIARAQQPNPRRR
jgi:hypothetical protein